MLKQLTKTTVRTAFALAIMVVTPAHALDYIHGFVPEAQKVGQGRLTYMFWKIYDATLYAPQGSWEQGRPFALRLSYLREIAGKKIADRSVVEMRNQGLTDEVKLATWHAQMRKIFPDVEPGVTITGIYTKNEEAVFYKNSEEVGRIKDPEFSRAFFAIWLSEKTSVPKLRRKLLGVV